MFFKCSECGRLGIFPNGLCESCTIAVKIRNTPQSPKKQSLNSDRNRQTQSNVTEQSVNPISRVNVSDVKEPWSDTDNKLLNLLRKYTNETDEIFAVNQLKYEPLTSLQIPKSQLNARVDSLVYNKYAKVGFCRRWIGETDNPDVYFSNYDDLLLTLKQLIEFEPYYPFYDPKPADLLTEYTDSRSEYNDDFLGRWWENVIEQVLKLKTENGRQNKINTLKQNLEAYKSRLTEDNIVLYSRIIEEDIYSGYTYKNKKVPDFDYAAEKDILTRLQSCESAIERHHVMSEAQNFYYKYRDVDPIYLQKCINFCYEDINSLEDVSREEAAIKNEWLQGQTYLDSDKMYIEYAEKALKYGFQGVIPAFKRLRIIYDKKKDFSRAIECCDLAIDYYTIHGMPTDASEFAQRKLKLQAKQLKENAPTNMPTVTSTISENISLDSMISTINKIAISQNYTMHTEDTPQFIRIHVY